MRVLFMISVIAFARVSGTHDCESAKKLVNEYKGLYVDMTMNPMIIPEKAASVKQARKNLLVEAAYALIESKAPDYDPKEYQCARVWRAFWVVHGMEENKSLAQIVESSGRLDRIIAQFTVVLGGKTLDSEANDVVLRLGSRMFELLRRSRAVVITHVYDDEVDWSVMKELYSLEFFETAGKGIAEKLLKGLDTFEEGLKYWEGMRKAANEDLREKNGIFRSYPAGYVLGAIKEVTSIAGLNVDLISKSEWQYFGVSFASKDDVVRAITPLVDFTQFADGKWMESLASDEMRDLLEGMFEADIYFEKNPSRMMKNYDHLGISPGIVFVRWISGNYHRGQYEGMSRLALAAKTAGCAAKIGVRQTDFLLAFLDTDSKKAELEAAYSWMTQRIARLEGFYSVRLYTPRDVINVAVQWFNSYARSDIKFNQGRSAINVIH